MKRIATCGLLTIAAIFTLTVFACIAYVVAERAYRANVTSSSDVEVDRDDDPVAHGQMIYERTCRGCHSIDGRSRTGPTFQGLYGSEVRLDSGETLIADDQYLRRAIIDPRATTRDGYRDIMPPFTDFDDQEIDALIAFIRAHR